MHLFQHCCDGTFLCNIQIPYLLLLSSRTSKVQQSLDCHQLLSIYKHQITRTPDFRSTRKLFVIQTTASLRSTIIPLHGDKVATKHFCQTKRDTLLLDQLRSSTLFKRKASTVADNRGEKLMGNKIAKKRYHQVELRWMHFSKGINRYQHVKKQEVVDPTRKSPPPPFQGH